jgi:signal peptidase I
MNDEQDRLDDERKVTQASRDPDYPYSGADASADAGAAAAVDARTDTSVVEGDRRYTPQAVSRRPLGCLIEIVETLVLTIVIFWVIQTFVAQPYQVQQQSMRTTLEEGQYVLVDKLTPRFDSYSRGDIVVFHPLVHEEACTDPATAIEGEDDVPFIKRVIGEPGDLVELRDGEVYVNDVKIDEPYVHGAATDSLGDGESWTVPADRLFVMGDNRGNSTDSRAFGPVCTNEVVGRAFLRYWPINTFGILQTPTYPNVPPAAAEAP